MKIQITSLVDVETMFASHAEVAPLAAAWRRALRAYLHGDGDAAAVEQARAACLERLRAGLNFAEISVAAAYARPIGDDGNAERRAA